ncbi:MAG: TetR/AcrR family transcriptional regulator [Bryobacteraceae bacterium]
MNATENTTKTTSERVLDAAEVLFARQGIRGTSLKEITELAEVNIAAVNYHFRSKNALARAVYERSFRPLNEQRLRALKAAEEVAGGAPLTVEAVLRALFEPMVRAWTSNRNFILLVGRLHHEPDSELSGFIQHLYQELIPRFLAALKRALPGAPETDLFFWTHFLFGGVVYTLLNSHDMRRLHEGQNLLDTPEIFLDRLIVFGASGLRALVPSDKSARNRENSTNPNHLALVEVDHAAN